MNKKVALFKTTEKPKTHAFGRHLKRFVLRPFT